jgi:hypothetical protein
MPRRSWRKRMRGGHLRRTFPCPSAAGNNGAKWCTPTIREAQSEIAPGVIYDDAWPLLRVRVGDLVAKAPAQRTQQPADSQHRFSFCDGPRWWCECPCHQGFFSIKDGSMLQGPPPQAENPGSAIAVFVSKENDEKISKGLLRTGTQMPPRGGDWCLRSALSCNSLRTSRNTVTEVVTRTKGIQACMYAARITQTAARVRAKFGWLRIPSISKSTLRKPIKTRPTTIRKTL